MAQPGLRPLGVFETIDASFTIYRSRFRDLVIVAVIVLVPVQIASYVLNLIVLDAADSLTAASDPSEVFGLLGLSLIVLGISFLGTLLITGSVAKTVGDAYLNVVTDWRESMSTAWSSLGRLIGNSILTALGIGLGILLCLIPGIYLFALWATAPVAVVLERRGPAEALGRARDLVRGRWWPVFGALIIAYLIQIILSWVVGTILGVILVFAEPGNATFLGVSSIFDLIIGVILQPFLAVVITVIYFDLRVRKEGFDLQVLADQLGSDLSALPEPDKEWGSDFPGLPEPDQDLGRPDGPEPPPPDDDPFG